MAPPLAVLVVAVRLELSLTVCVAQKINKKKNNLSRILTILESFWKFGKPKSNGRSFLKQRHVGLVRNILNVYVFDMLLYKNKKLLPCCYNLCFTFYFFNKTKLKHISSAPLRFTYHFVLFPKSLFLKCVDPSR